MGVPIIHAQTHRQTDRYTERDNREPTKHTSTASFPCLGTMSLELVDKRHQQQRKKNSCWENKYMKQEVNKGRCHLRREVPSSTPLQTRGSSRLVSWAWEWHPPVDSHAILLLVLFLFYVYILFSHSLSRIPLPPVSRAVFTEIFTRTGEIEETLFSSFSGNVRSFFSFFPENR